MKTTIAILFAAAAALQFSCDLEPWEPDVGPPTQPFCLDEDLDDSVDVSFSADIMPLIFAVPDPDDPNAPPSFGCNGCHVAPGIGVEVGGLDLGSYQSLRTGGLVSANNAVVPGQPCNSILFQKVSSGPPFGARMPLDGPPYLDQVALDLLHDWIAEGAKDN